MSSSPNSFQNSFDSYEPKQELDSPFLNEEYLDQEARNAHTWRMPAPGFQLESSFLEAFEEGWGANSEVEEEREFEEDFGEQEIGIGENEEELEAEADWFEVSDFVNAAAEAPHGDILLELENDVEEFYNDEEEPAYLAENSFAENAAYLIEETASPEDERNYDEEFLIELEAPPLLKNPIKSDPPGQTLYVQIRLGKDKRCVKRNEKEECVEYQGFTIRPMTGIFIPENYVPQAEIDLILYLHGHKSSIPGSDALIAQYWDGKKYPVFALREEINASQKNVILVAPTLGLKSEGGDLVRPNGLDNYLNQVLEVLKTYGPYQGQSPTLGKLILAAHSGGGVYMRMLAISSNRYAGRINECWGFDSLYNSSDVKHWINWAKKNPQASFFSYFFTRFPTRNSRNLIGKAPNIHPIESDIKNHFNLVKYHLRKRLKETQFLKSIQDISQELSEFSLSSAINVFDEFVDDFIDEEFAGEEFDNEGIFEGTEELEEYSEYLSQEDAEPELGEVQKTFSSGDQEELYEQNEASPISEVTFPSGESLAIVKGAIARGEEHYDPTTDPNDAEFKRRKVHLPLLPLLDVSGSNRSKKLSKDFTAGEFAQSGSQKFDKARIDPRLVECLQALRDHLGKPITITSGYRPYTYNINIYKKSGKEPTKSQHTSGRAVDIKIPGLSGLEIAKAAIDICGCDMGVGIGYTYAHIDVRGEFQKWTYIEKKSKKDYDKVLREITAHRNQKCKGHPEPGKQTTTLPSGSGSHTPKSTTSSPNTSNKGTSKPIAELVRFAQRVLNATEGERLDDDGDFGKLTRGALERFRKKYHLGFGGVLDAKTELALAQRVLEEIAQQSLFSQLGMLDTKIDQMLVAFKSVRGLGLNSKLDVATRVALTDALSQRTKAAKPTVSDRIPSSLPKLGIGLIPPSDLAMYRKFRITTYHGASEPMVSNEPLVPVLTRKGEVIANVPAGFFAEMALEGRGRLKDGRLLTGDDWRSRDNHDYSSVLNVHRQRFPKGNKYYDRTKVSGITVVNDKVTTVRAYAAVPTSQLGQGYGILRGISLEPYRTVAADIGAFKNSDDRYRGAWSSQKGRYVVVNGKTGLVPTGTQVYIRQLDGVTLPNGKRHDGWVIVNDTGGGIFGAHFDVFVGEKQNGEPLMKSLKSKFVDVWFDGIEQRIPPGYTYGLT